MPDATDNTPQSALLGHIADQLRRLRASRGLSASALARQAGIAKSTLTQLELGRGNPGIETLWALANTLGVPFAELIAAAPADVAIVRAGQGTTTEDEQATMQATLIDTAWSGRRQSLYRLHLAAGAACPVQAYRVGERVYTTQFHPEPTPADFIERMTVYRNDGYFDADDFDVIADRVRPAELDAPLTLLRTFATRIAL